MPLLHIDEDEWLANAGRTPFLFTHELATDPRLAHDAVVDLAGRLKTEDVEINQADLPTVMDSDHVPELDGEPAQLARDIESMSRWMALSYIEQVPEYHEVVHGALQSAGPAVATWGGGMQKLEGYIFLSAPNAITPAHVDHEHNFLLQINGTKNVTIGSFHGGDEEQRALEGMYSGHYGRTRGLPDDARTFTIAPGQGVYIPPRAVHMIENTGAMSISLSLVWHTPELDRASRVYALNAKLRRLGLDPRPPERSALVDNAKSATVIAWRKLRRIDA